MFSYPILLTLLLGLLAGWLATKIVGGTGGILRNLAIGLVGALVGHWIFGAVGIWVGGPFITSFLAAVFGGVIVIGISRFLAR
ncbi:MAG: GlsB/YeaQ/YmgE family stress response membrane protein [Rhizobiales bacterium]|nr:GlsB/YeaQ/YmgE family stress response membrane protein [Hyphomicrobiales bacterium]